jgi:hypothetical protein
MSRKSIPGMGKSGIARINSCVFTEDVVSREVAASLFVVRPNPEVTSADLRRLAIAFACSIALHEIAIALIPQQLSQDKPEVRVAHVSLLRVIPKPTPVHIPTPAPTPTPPPRKVIAPTVVAAGVHARVEKIKHVGEKRPTPPHVLNATPDVSIPTGGQGAGAQRGQGAGSVSQTNGNGSGTGTTGNGNGAALCGAVDFEASGAAAYDPQSGYYERSNIVATVYYADGTSERIPLDWTWRFKSEDNDPFNPASGAPMLFQFPPENLRASEPPAIQYIIDHTTAAGRTKLNDQCPNIPPPPSPQP